MGTDKEQWTIRRVMTDDHDQKLEQRIDQLPPFIFELYGRAIKLVPEYAPEEYRI